MGNNGEKPRRVGKLVRYTAKMVSFLRRSIDRSGTEVSIPPPTQAVHCDDLFFSSGKCEGTQIDGIAADPVVAAMIVAQNHFSLRPNLLI